MELKQKAKRYFAKYKNIKSKFIVSSIDNFCNNIKLEKDSVLTIFPFNLIGNLNNIKSLLERCYNNQYDIIISQFNTTLYAKKIRKIYYKKCFKSNLFFYDNKNSHIFKNEIFESISYKKEYIIEICNEIGFTCVDFIETDLFCIQYFRRT